MSCPGIVIKVDNREADLIPLIERRIEAYLLESSPLLLLLLLRDLQRKVRMGVWSHSICFRM